MSIGILAPVSSSTSGALDDVGDLLRTETLFREGQAHFRTILESAAIGISVNTPEGVPVLSNPALQKMLGYSGDELRNMSYLQFTHPDDREGETLLMADLIAGCIDKYQVEKRYIRKDGRVMWGRLTVSLLGQGNGGPHHFVAMVEDITERKRAENESRQRETQLEVLAELSMALREAVSYPQVMDCLVERAADALSAHGCGLLLIEDHKLKLAASRRLNDVPDSFGIVEDDNLAWQVIRSNQPLLIPCCMNDAASSVIDPVRVDPLHALASGASYLALAPLRSSEVTIGLLLLTFNSTDEPSPSVRKLLDPVVDIASNAIERARLLQTLEQKVSDRTRRLKILYEVSKAASHSHDLHTMLLSALQTLIDAMPGCAGALHLLEGEPHCRPALVQYGLPAEMVAVIEQGFWAEAPWTRILQNGFRLQLSKGTRDRRVPDWLQQAGWQAHLGVPIRATGEVVGVLSLFWRTEPRLTIDDLETISAVAEEIGRSVERSELRQQAEQALIAEERQRLARDLHDSVTQLLCGQGLLAEASRSFVKTGHAAQAEPYLDQLVETAHQALKEMRLMIYNLRPSVLAAEGLMGALNWRLEAVEQRAGIKAQLIGEITAPLSKQEEEALYRVVQELLNNILKHAGASSVTILLRDTPEDVEIEVTDDGKGFDVAASRQGIGLKSVHERMERLGGTLNVISRPGQGCRVVARLRKASGACA